MTEPTDNLKTAADYEREAWAEYDACDVDSCPDHREHFNWVCRRVRTAWELERAWEARQHLAAVARKPAK